MAEFDYRAGKCNKTYRVVVLRKNLTVEKGDLALFDDPFSAHKKLIFSDFFDCNIMPIRLTQVF